jgi:CMP-N-acetylneuraminic acid synthetase
VTPVSQHPAKMWTVDGPVMEGARDDRTPWHSCPTQTLPPVYVQTAGLEVTTPETLAHSLAGHRVGIHIITGPEALDINTPEDWARAEEIAKTWTAR